MSEALTVAIVGAGRIAGGYDRERTDASPGIFTHAGAYLRDGRFALQTVIDTDLEKALRFAEEWNVASAGAALSQLCEAHYDVVSVCTPDQTHAAVINALIQARAAKTIFAEKPLALSSTEIRDIRQAAEKSCINVVVNFQRRYDPAHMRLRDIIAADRDKLRSVNAYYIKGLDHIGTTIIDTICFLCGTPHAVFAYNRIFNKTIQDYSYEFILFFDTFNVTVKTVDAENQAYEYHIFELDFLMSDKRIVVNDNSRRMDTRMVVDFAYSEVRCLDDRNPVIEETGFASSMLDAVEYVHAITTGARRHDENTPESSYRVKCIVEAVKQSYQEQLRVQIGEMRG